jgi:hypothetical protein
MIALGEKKVSFWPKSPQNCDSMGLPPYSGVRGKARPNCVKDFSNYLIFIV